MSDNRIPIFHKGDISSLPVGYLVLTDEMRAEVEEAGAHSFLLSFITVDTEAVGVAIYWMPTPPGTVEVRMPVPRDANDQREPKLVLHMNKTRDILLEHLEEASISGPPSAYVDDVEAVISYDRVGVSHITGTVVTVHGRTKFPEISPSYEEHRIVARYALTLCGARIYQPEDAAGDWLRRLDDGPRLRECPACRADFPVTA